MSLVTHIMAPAATQPSSARSGGGADAAPDAPGSAFNALLAGEAAARTSRAVSGKAQPQLQAETAEAQPQPVAWTAGAQRHLTESQSGDTGANQPGSGGTVPAVPAETASPAPVPGEIPHDETPHDETAPATAPGIPGQGAADDAGPTARLPAAPQDRAGIAITQGESSHRSAASPAADRVAERPAQPARATPAQPSTPAAPATPAVQSAGAEPVMNGTPPAQAEAGLQSSAPKADAPPNAEAKAAGTAALETAVGTRSDQAPPAPAGKAEAALKQTANAAKTDAAPASSKVEAQSTPGSPKAEAQPTPAPAKPDVQTAPASAQPDTPAAAPQAKPGESAMQMPAVPVTGVRQDRASSVAAPGERVRAQSDAVRRDGSGGGDVAMRVTPDSELRAAATPQQPAMPTPGATLPGLAPAGATVLEPVAELAAEPAFGTEGEATLDGLRLDRSERGAELARAANGVPHSARMLPAQVQTLAARIAQRFNEGTRVFDIRIDPPELGRVGVRLEMGRDNRVNAILTAERPEALAELQRSARDLERSLAEAGLDLGEDGLSFQLADKQSGDGQDGEGFGHARAFALPVEGNQHDITASTRLVAHDIYGFAVGAQSRLDLSV